MRLAWWCARIGIRGAHVTGIQRRGHLKKQADEIVRHSHLNHGGTNLIVGRVDVSKLRLADRFADNGGGFGVVEIALALQFLRLLAAEGELQRASAAAAPMSRVAIMESLRSGRRGPMAEPIMRIAAAWPRVFSMKYPARK